MHLFVSWKNSLMLFLPKNLKLFGLVVLRSIRDTYSLLWRYARMEILIYLGVDFLVFMSYLALKFFSENDAVLLGGVNQHEASTAVTGAIKIFLQIFTPILMMLLLLVSLLLFFYSILFARSSVNKKDGAYLCEWRRNYMFPLYLAQGAISILIIAPISLSFLYFGAGNSRLFGLISMVFENAYFLFAFFFLDTIGKMNRAGMGRIKAFILACFYSLKNTGKMLIYNAPVFCAVAFLFIMFYKMILVSDVLSMQIIGLFSGICRPIIICLYGVLYTKYSYEQVSLYLEGPNK